jgi:hypothetical protein
MWLDRNYILMPDHSVRVASNIIEWSIWFEHSEDRIVKQETVWGPFGSQHVSTVFLGLDHRFGDDGPPLIFETMIFGGPIDQEYQTRTATWDEALADHQLALLEARSRRWNIRGWLRYHASWLIPMLHADWKEYRNFMLAGLRLDGHIEPALTNLEKLSLRLKVGGFRRRRRA